MQTFIKRFPIAQGFTALFTFTRIYSVNGVLFHVTVSDRSRALYVFNIMQTEEGWKINTTKKLPEWITELEDQFAQAITEECSG